MLIAYLNYPNSSVSVHGNPMCRHVRSHRKDGQRTVKLSIESLSAEIKRFGRDGHAFGSTPENNDMWLEIDCADQVFDAAVAKYIHSSLAGRYKPFASAKWHECECFEKRRAQ